MAGSPTNRIDADSHPVEEVFKSFFAVPEFQREYVWKQRHVKKLLSDLYAAFTAKDTDNYFLGSIVFYEEDDICHLVDGQQRMTTLFILISAIRDRLRILDSEADLDIYDHAIKSSYKARAGGIAYQYRVVLQYPEISQVLQLLGDGQGDQIQLPRGESPRRNLVTAHALCADFLVEQFGEDFERLDAFFTFVWKDVEMITIHTEDMRTAFTIFETINDRGVGLDAMDLLKNLLFRQTPVASRNSLAAKWRDLLRVLRDGQETRPIRFLRYYLISAYEFERVPTAASVFDWIVDDANKRRMGYGKNPGAFADNLLDAAEAYSNFARGRSADGSDNPYLQAINYQRTGVRQHLCLLLAARHLRGNAFAEVCQALERLVFVLAATSAQWNEIEKALPAWTKVLRSARSKQDVDDFINNHISPMLKERLPLFKSKLEDTSTLPDRLKRYMLAALTQHLEEQCGKGGGFDRYFTEHLTIEHIYPQSTSEDQPGPAAQEWINQFHPSQESAQYVHRLGNLALLHRVPNSSAQDAPFRPTKLGWYKKCPYDLTRTIAEEISGGKNTKLTRTVEKYGLHPYRAWTSASLEERHLMMLRMVEEYWGVQFGDQPLAESVGVA